jgi:hypothetical protein
MVRSLSQGDGGIIFLSVEESKLSHSAGRAPLEAIAIAISSTPCNQTYLNAIREYRRPPKTNSTRARKRVEIGRLCRLLARNRSTRCPAPGVQLTLSRGFQRLILCSPNQKPQNNRRFARRDVKGHAESASLLVQRLFGRFAPDGVRSRLMAPPRDPAQRRSRK